MSGPHTTPPPRSANSPKAYREWRQTADGRSAFRHMVTDAVQQFEQGAARVSIAAVVEAARAALKVEINNTYKPWLADDLIEADDRLERVIERRRRWTGGPDGPDGPGVEPGTETAPAQGRLF